VSTEILEPNERGGKNMTKIEKTTIPITPSMKEATQRAIDRICELQPNPPQTLQEAILLPDGPRSKFYMVNLAPKGLDKKTLKKLSCKEIREWLLNDAGIVDDDDLGREGSYSR
jgi:hypothetical protein